MDRIQGEVPDIFPSPAEAIRWGMDQGVFKDEAHTQNAYEKVRRERNPQSAREMRDAWVEEVMGRKEVVA
jgi:hypothetical protein